MGRRSEENGRVRIFLNVLVIVIEELGRFVGRTLLGLGFFYG